MTPRIKASLALFLTTWLLGCGGGSSGTHELSSSPMARSAPSEVAAASGNSQATVTFKASENSGERVIGYTVVSNPPGGVDVHAGSTSLNHVVTGLSNATLYTFTVIAAFGSGTSTPSQPSNGVIPVAPAPAGNSGWLAVANLLEARTNHMATLLPNGKVLVIGGSGKNGLLATAELYDPSTDLWSPAGALQTARRRATATVLLSGKVLVAGGADGNGNALASVELYDPATNRWTSAATLSVGRIGHGAILLPNGKVMVAGGSTGSGFTLEVELYDPATNIWSNAAKLPNGISSPSLSLQPDGRILAYERFWVQIYDTASDLWIVRSNHWGESWATYTPLLDGRLLEAGGNYYNPAAPVLIASSTSDTARIYDPITNIWPNRPGRLQESRSEHAASLLPNGKVLLVGGRARIRPDLLASEVPRGTVELYDTATQLSALTFPLTIARYGHTATLLPNGKVLVVGGAGSDNVPLAGVELYSPG